jgi:hypothetical protein
VNGEAETETGKPTLWDNAWREGHAHGLMHALGIPYRDAYLRTAEMLTGKLLDRSSAQTRNSAGAWVPSIPLPLYGLRKHCGCGRKFWTADAYRGHYALCHVLKLGDTA